MIIKHPFRDLRAAQRLLQAECGLLLGVKQVEFPNQDYAMFAAMSGLTKQLDNPTYARMYGATGAWLRFLRTLIQRLPEENELRDKAQVEFDKLAVIFADMLEVKA